VIEDLPLLGQAAAAGIGQNAFRDVVGFAGGGEPEDWRPAPGEHGAAATTAWRLVLKVLDRIAAEARPDIVRNLAENLRLAYRLSLSSTIEAALRDREWLTDERTLLAAGLGDVLRYEDWLPDDLKAGVADLRAWMLDDAGSGRLGVVVATPVWELHDDEATLQEDPPALVSLADELAAEEGGLERLVASATLPHDVQTRCRLAGLVAERLGSEHVGEAAIAASWSTSQRSGTTVSNRSSKRSSPGGPRGRGSGDSGSVGGYGGCRRRSRCGSSGPWLQRVSWRPPSGCSTCGWRSRANCPMPGSTSQWTSQSTSSGAPIRP
jgi:hypothetical protein